MESLIRQEGPKKQPGIEKETRIAFEREPGLNFGILLIMHLIVFYESKSGINRY